MPGSLIRIPKTRRETIRKIEEKKIKDRLSKPLGTGTIHGPFDEDKKKR